MISINPEFAKLIPPLTTEERAGLERSILEEGVREPLITWNGWIVDGHNRYEIATAYGLDFETVEYDFDSEDDAKAWMILNQFARRNLSAYNRSELALELEPLLAKEAKKKMASHTNQGYQKSDNPVNTLDEIASYAGVSRDTISRAKKIKNDGSEELQEQVKSGEVSINAAYKQIREAEKKAERKAAIEEAKSQPRSSSYVDIFTTNKKYRVIYADPPWSYNDKRDGHGGAVSHYNTMPLDDICELPIPAEKDAVLFLWATSPLLPEAFEVIRAWNFDYKTSFVWDKVAHALGHYNSVRHELLLVATKGSCTPDSDRRYDSVVSIERTEHSAKPAYFRDLIDELYPVGHRIELFARESNDGWDVWGDMA